MGKKRKRDVKRTGAKETASAGTSAAPESLSADTKATLGARRVPNSLFVVIAVLTSLLIVFPLSCQDGEVGEEDITYDHPRPTPPRRMQVRVHRRIPHQADAFTQGLLWHDGHLYESTGLRGRSSLRMLDLDSGEVLRRRNVEPELFAEGLARVGTRLYQLTWTSRRVLVWDANDFSFERSLGYQGEGWGLCFDGRRLVMSNGSSRLTFRDPENFRELGHVTVRREGRPVRFLNELECVDGMVWANVWQEDEILRVDPSNGRVLAVVDASGLLTEEERRRTRADVLNGIAWIPEREHFVVTGKNWPWAFEVDFVEATP